ncbi:hypothetical protein GA0115246_100414 [Streptomyces sp. SolWspMP-sol7th]|nr:hypothetical protein GA0115246_100414 [Streptomyces sp. SolWspMP-sol7th]
MTPKSVSTSRGSSEDVGSSMMTTFAFTETARASATICWVPTLSSPSGRRTSTRTPSAASACAASRCIRPKSTRPRARRGSRPRKRLRATLMSGTRFTSW